MDGLIGHENANALKQIGNWRNFQKLRKNIKKGKSSIKMTLLKRGREDKKESRC
jgi:hypothetical protein